MMREKHGLFSWKSLSVKLLFMGSQSNSSVLSLCADAEETTGVTCSEIVEQESLARSLDPLQFDFGVIRAATTNFSIENKLGEGGFGPVYKVPTIHSND